MAENIRDLSTPGAQPLTGVAVGHNAVAAGKQVLYYHGIPLEVPEEHRAQLELELGLIPEQHDVEAAITEVNVHYQAIGATLASALAEIGEAGHLLDEADAAMAAAVGAFVDRWRWLQRSLAGTLPTEATIRAVAEHKALHGDLADVPTLQRYEALADAYAAAHPIDTAALAARAAADNQQAAQALLEQAIRLAAGGDPLQAETARQRAQSILGGQS